MFEQHMNTPITGMPRLYRKQLANSPKVQNFMFLKASNTVLLLAIHFTSLWCHDLGFEV